MTSETLQRAMSPERVKEWADALTYLGFAIGGLVVAIIAGVTKLVNMWLSARQALRGLTRAMIEDPHTNDEKLVEAAKENISAPAAAAIDKAVASNETERTGS